MTNIAKKRIAAITMARNDTFFLTRWIAYYGAELGEENLYIYLDGLDQEVPVGAGRATVKKFRHVEQTRQRGDKTRIKMLSALAADLFARGYEIVIGCDCDEFLIADPATNMGLAEYLSSRPTRCCLSGLGLDVGMDWNTEDALDIGLPFLAQRRYAVLSTRYTKPVVLMRPATWGSGFHSVKGHNFHIDKNLYLLHFGGADLEMIKSKIGDRAASWENHLKKRARTIDIITRTRRRHASLWLARVMQTILRPIYDWNKPAMLGRHPVTTIPDRFQKTGI